VWFESCVLWLWQVLDRAQYSTSSHLELQLAFLAVRSVQDAQSELKLVLDPATTARCFSALPAITGWLAHGRHCGSTDRVLKLIICTAQQQCAYSVREYSNSAVQRLES
jgi:hypothetical protein